MKRRRYVYSMKGVDRKGGMGRGRGGPGRGLGYGPGRRSAMLRAVAAQKNEITEHYIYDQVAQGMKPGPDKEVVGRLARQEREHYDLLKAITGKNIKPARWKVWLYSWVTRLLGLSFGLQLMEKGEELAQETYDDLSKDYPQAAEIMRDEQEHEEKLLGLINEKLLSYVGSIVLGLNDALIELTGALAGLTLALRDTSLIAMVGFITGFAASLSMGASEYLSTKEEEGENAWQSGVITGITYLMTVIILIAPYFVFENAFAALGTALILSIVIILAFTFYTSVAKNIAFKKRFATMAFISLGVAVINFGVGILVKRFLGVEL